MPVSARRSVVLPWSMWPAVPTTTLTGPPATSSDAGGRARSSSTGVTVRRSSSSSPSSIRASTRSGSRAGGAPPPRRVGQRHRERRPTAAPGPAASRRRPSTRGSRPARADAPGVRRPTEPHPGIHARPLPELLGRRARSSATPGCRSPPGPPGTARALRRRPRGSPCPAARHAPGDPVASAPPGHVARPPGPACGPPTSLSPLNRTTSAPAARRSRRRGLVGEAEGGRIEQGAGAEVVDDERTVRPGDAPRPPRGPRSRVKPAMAKLDGCTRSTAVARPSARTASKSAARVRFVVPTSTRRAPARRDHLRDPHAAADLHQLAPRHGDPRPPARQPARPAAVRPRCW